MATELTLAAALRDAASPDARARNLGVRNLAPALLAEAGLPSPSWDASAKHRLGAQVLEALQRIVNEDGPHQERGMAMIGMGQLGEAGCIELAQAWLERGGDDEAAVFLREAAVIAMSFVGTAAPVGEPVRERVRQWLAQALSSPHDDVRFQAGPALAELGGDDVQSRLVEALKAEQQPKVRENLVCALAVFDPPSEAACAVLVAVLEAEARPSSTGFEAALALAGARRPEAGARLVEALGFREERDLALEALAALGPLAPRAAIAPIRTLARGWFTPAVTKVRAAYALARLAPGEGLPMLNRLSRHLRPAVREGVRDAYAAMAQLQERERTTD